MSSRNLSTRCIAASVLWLGALTAAHAADPAVERGKYLVSIAGCGDCHTPGYFLGKPDFSHLLGGSEVGFELPGLGVFHGPNLTPDRDTGLGAWSDAEIATALTKGTRPDGRQLAPIMPWRNLAVLAPADLKAIVAYLRSLPAVRNKVPGPFGPLETSTSYVMKVVPPQPLGTKIEVGGTLAERWCKSCHVVGRTPSAGTAGGPPSFMSIAARPGRTAEQLDGFLSEAHTRMPDFALTRTERDLLIAYIQSLR